MLSSSPRLKICRNLFKKHQIWRVSSVAQWCSLGHPKTTPGSPLVLKMGRRAPKSYPQATKRRPPESNKSLTSSLKRKKSTYKIGASGSWSPTGDNFLLEIRRKTSTEDFGELPPSRHPTHVKNHQFQIGSDGIARNSPDRGAFL